MPDFIEAPAVVQAAGNKPKQIEEYFGRMNSGTEDVSIARMVSPAGWIEPGQRPEFDEYAVVLKGELVVEFEGGSRRIPAGQGVKLKAGEWVRYSTPDQDTEYVAVCLPAFSMETVNREDD